MKNLFRLALATLVFSIVACQKQKIENENAPQPPKVAAYKIPLDSLKKQAVALGAIFGDPATKSRSVTAANAIAVSTVLGAKHMTKSYNTDPDSPQAYVINFNDDQGFAILVDDKRVGNNILAYSQSGNIDQSTDNPGVLLFMDQATEYLSLLGFDPIHIPENYSPNTSVEPSNWGRTTRARCNWNYIRNKTTNSRTPLISLKWGQGSPYNAALPKPAGGYFYTGCTATAVAMLMSYHQWPTSITVDGSTRNINWSQAISGDIIGGNIHYLMKDFGIKVNMNYKESSSGAQAYQVRNAFISYGFTVSNYIDYNINTMIGELNSSRPAYICGYDNNGAGGHAWLVDGYIEITNLKKTATDYVDDSNVNSPVLVGQKVTSTTQTTSMYFHCNWGWDGNNNGYFIDFNTADPYTYDSNTNPSSYNFQNNEMLYNIAH